MAGILFHIWELNWGSEKKFNMSKIIHLFHSRNGIKHQLFLILKIMLLDSAMRFPMKQTFLSTSVVCYVAPKCWECKDENISIASTLKNTSVICCDDSYISSINKVLWEAQTWQWLLSIQELGKCPPPVLLMCHHSLYQKLPLFLLLTALSSQYKH